MNAYSDYRLSLRLLSPLGTPMQSDTLFGHLAWQVRFAEGADGVGRFLAPFMEGRPPFVLSDAFPAGLLPRPLFPRRAAPVQDRPGYAEFKRWKKAPFVPVEGFLALVRGEAQSAPPAADPWRRAETPHAAISRSTGTTGEGGNLYQTEAIVLEGGMAEVYVRALDGWAGRVEELFRRMARTGFGKDKSVGCGAFEVAGMEPWGGFAPPGGADGFVSLSALMPAAQDPAEGRWRLRVKRGFLGEQAGAGNPFKRPLVQLAPGAVFRGAPRPWAGRMVPDVAPGMAEAVQCGYALAAACKWPDVIVV